MDTVGEGGSGTNGESNTNIRTLSGVRWIAGEKVLGSTGSPLWCSVMTWKAGLGGHLHFLLLLLSFPGSFLLTSL